MRFLVDADLPRSTAGLIRACGHEADDVRDVGLTSAPDHAIATEARKREACIITGDFGFADIRSYPPGDYFGIVVLTVPQHAFSQNDSQLDQAHAGAS